MRNKKILIPIAIVGLILLTLALLELTHVTNFVKKNPAAPTTSEGPTPEQKKQDDAINAHNKQKLVESDDTQTSTNTPSKNITITTRQESNGTVTVLTKLTGYSSGTCALKVTSGSNSTSLSANVIYQSEFSSCAGFSVPVSSLGKGSWTLSLDVTSNGSTESKTATIEVN